MVSSHHPSKYSSELSAHLSSELPAHSFFCPFDSTDPSTLAASLCLCLRYFPFIPSPLAFPSSCLPYFWCLLHFSSPPFCSPFRNRLIPYPFLPPIHSNISLDRSTQAMPHLCCHLTIPASHHQSSSSLLPRQTQPVLLTSLRPPLSAAPLPLFTALYSAYCTIALNLYITSLHRILYHYIAHRLNATELSAQYSTKLSAQFSFNLAPRLAPRSEPSSKLRAQSSSEPSAQFSSKQRAQSSSKPSAQLSSEPSAISVPRYFPFISSPLAFPSSCLPYFRCLLHFSSPPFCSPFRNRPIPYPFHPQIHSSISLDGSPQPMPHSWYHPTIPPSTAPSSHPNSVPSPRPSLARKFCPAQPRALSPVQLLPPRPVWFGALSPVPPYILSTVQYRAITSVRLLHRNPFSS
jgi:hypothetical protein